MNASLDSALAEAATRAAQYDRVYAVYPTHDGFASSWVRDDAPRVSLLFTTDVGDSFWIVYPSGLAIPLHRVNWFWEFETEVRLGTADQAARYARGKKLDPAFVYPVAPDRVHGTCVRYGEDEDYSLVQARSFPAWAGR